VPGGETPPWPWWSCRVGSPQGEYARLPLAREQDQQEGLVFLQFFRLHSTTQTLTPMNTRTLTLPL